MTNERRTLWLLLLAVALIAWLLLRRRVTSAAGESSLSIVTGDIGHTLTVEEPRHTILAWRLKVPQPGEVKFTENENLGGHFFAMSSGLFYIPHDPSTAGPRGFPAGWRTYRYHNYALGIYNRSGLDAFELVEVSDPFIEYAELRYGTWPQQ